MERIYSVDDLKKFHGQYVAYVLELGYLDDRHWLTKEELLFHIEGEGEGEEDGMNIYFGIIGDPVWEGTEIAGYTIRRFLNRGTNHRNEEYLNKRTHKITQETLRCSFRRLFMRKIVEEEKTLLVKQMEQNKVVLDGTTHLPDEYYEDDGNERSDVLYMGMEDECDDDDQDSDYRLSENSDDSD